MKNLTPITLLMSLLQLIYNPATAQINLVPNPSFEEYVSCPNSLEEVDGNLKNWRSFKGSPDYFNNCSSNLGFANVLSYQKAHTGEAYVGFINCDVNNNAEQIGVKLNSSLIKGNKYYVSFYLSLAYNNYSLNISSNKMGVMFSTLYHYDSLGIKQLSNYSQVFSSIVIKDTVNWIKVSGSFIADSAYEYLIIGGLFDINQLDTTYLPNASPPSQSYYFLDDVCLSEDSTICYSNVSNCDFILPTAFSPNGDNMNDTYKWITNCTNYADYIMNIYNRWGEKVFTSNNSNYTWDGIFKGEQQPSDVYAVYVSVVVDGKPISKISNLTLFR